MKKKRRALLLRGVALIVVNPRGEILLLRELEAKPDLGKYVGIFSIPMETIKKKKKESKRKALARLVDEELGGFPVEMERTRRGEYKIAPRAKAFLYVGKSVSFELPLRPQMQGEVDGYRWERPEEALKLWIRRGVREMLGDYLKGRRGVTRRYCRPVAPRR